MVIRGFKTMEMEKCWIWVYQVICIYGKGMFPQIVFCVFCVFSVAQRRGIFPSRRHDDDDDDGATSRRRHDKRKPLLTDNAVAPHRTAPHLPPALPCLDSEQPANVDGLATREVWAWTKVMVLMCT